MAWRRFVSLMALTASLVSCLLGSLFSDWFLFAAALGAASWAAWRWTEPVPPT